MYWKIRKTTLLFITIILLVGVGVVPVLAKEPPKPKPIRADVPILLYHHIGNTANEWFVEPAMFERQLSVLAAHSYHSLTMTEYLDDAKTKTFPSQSIVFTFDDGYLDNYLFAFPLLKQYGFKGTFYIVSGKIGTDGYMTWAQLREMQAAGMEIGAHTLTHPFLSKLNPAAAWLEVYLSGAQIAQHLGSFPATFAYPYNDRNARVQLLPKLAGYQAALAVSPHKGDVSGDLYTIPRITILRGETIRTFSMVVGRGY